MDSQGTVSECGGDWGDISSSHTVIACLMHYEVTTNLPILEHRFSALTGVWCSEKS